MTKVFNFKQFSVAQEKNAMKVGTDGILLGAWTETNGIKNALDIGTGTGVIALMLAQKNNNIQVTGIDIEETFIEEARANFERSPWKDNLKAEAISIQDFAKVHPSEFDLIVSNPPFFSGGNFTSPDQRAQARHTIKLPHNDLLNAVRKLLSFNGKFNLILPYLEGLRFVEMAEKFGLYNTKYVEVIGKAGKPIERILLEFSKKRAACLKSTLSIRDENSVIHKEFEELTKDFYL